MKKPIIGITSNLLYRAAAIDGKFATNNNREYDEAILQAGGIPLLLPITTDLDCIKHYVDLCDGILLAGGDDINPLLYGEEPDRNLGETNAEVDCNHLALAKYTLEKGKPLLGICRGMQVLNIACSGNVYQDLGDYPRDHIKHAQIALRAQCCHTIITEEGSKLHQLLGSSFPVNSFHHQAVHRLGENVLATAWAKDRIIEGIEVTTQPFAIGVQWHPEIMLHLDTSMQPLFTAFIHACTLPIT